MFRFDVRPNGRTVMCREVIQDHHLSRGQGWTQEFSDVPLKTDAIDRALQNERGKGTTGLQRAHERLIPSPVAGHRADRAPCPVRATISSSHRCIEPTLIKKDQTGRRLKVGFEVVQELLAQFLIAFGGDPRFFWR